MEDSKDKVRRNLVVFSAIILGYQYLQLKIDVTKIPFMGINIASIPNPEKLWKLAFVIGIYLTYRFIVLPETKATLTSLIAQVKSSMRMRTDNLLIEVATDACKTKKKRNINVKIPNFRSPPILPEHTVPFKCQVLNTGTQRPKSLLKFMFLRRSYIVVFEIADMLSDTIRQNFREYMQQNSLDIVAEKGKTIVRVPMSIRLPFFKLCQMAFKVMLKNFFTWEFSETYFALFLTVLAFICITKNII